MNDTEIGIKDKLSILALEYNSLRSHINSRVSSMFQLCTVLVAITALILRESAVEHLTTLILVGTGFVIVFFLLWHDMVKAGKRVQQLETEINKRANEKLLIWENELGGISRGYWS